MQNRDLLWVNGPNRQFEAASEAVRAPTFGKRVPYEVFYLMEPDSVPWRPNWLDSLVIEIESHRPFAVLGRFFLSLTRSLYNYISLSFTSEANFLLCLIASAPRLCK